MVELLHSGPRAVALLTFAQVLLSIRSGAEAVVVVATTHSTADLARSPVIMPAVVLSSMVSSSTVLRWARTQASKCLVALHIKALRDGQAVQAVPLMDAQIRIMDEAHALTLATSTMLGGSCSFPKLT